MDLNRIVNESFIHKPPTSKAVLDCNLILVNLIYDCTNKLLNNPDEYLDGDFIWTTYLFNGYFNSDLTKRIKELPDFSKLLAMKFALEQELFHLNQSPFNN